MRCRIYIDRNKRSYFSGMYGNDNTEGIKILPIMTEDKSEAIIFTIDRAGVTVRNFLYSYFNLEPKFEYLEEVSAEEKAIEVAAQCDKDKKEMEPDEYYRTYPYQWDDHWNDSKTENNNYDFLKHDEPEDFYEEGEESYAPIDYVEEGGAGEKICHQCFKPFMPPRGSNETICPICKRRQERVKKIEEGIKEKTLPDSILKEIWELSEELGKFSRRLKSIHKKHLNKAKKVLGAKDE